MPKSDRTPGHLPIPMTIQEFQPAKSLWKLEYAHATFKAVQKGLRYLIQRKLEQTAPEYYPLGVGIVCLYCRPFTDVQPVGRLPEKIIPPEYRDHHKRIMQFRNEIFAHSVPGAILGPNQYMNAVKLRKYRGRFALYLTTSTPMPEFFERITPLVTFLVQETNRRRSQELSRLTARVPVVHNGYFRLNVFDQSGPIFIDTEDAWPDESKDLHAQSRED